MEITYQVICIILSKVMEDGEVIDSTSAMTTHKAVTSIHIDMNRMSQVYGNVTSGSFDDLGIPKNIISRFDFIVEIPANIERQFEIVSSIADGQKELLSAEHNYNLPEWAKKLKRMVAYMATKYDKAIISKEIGNYLKRKLKEKLNEGLQFQNFNTANELVSTRIPISLEKYAKAIACSKLKTNVEKEDIDEAFSFLNYKLDLLSNYKMTDNDPDKRSTEKIKRKEMIAEKFAGSEFTKKEIITYFESQEMNVNSRTIDRDIQELQDSGIIKRLGRGKYKFC